MGHRTRGDVFALMRAVNVRRQTSFLIVTHDARLSTPRNVAMPAFRALGAMFPQLDVKNANDPAFIAAQQQLGAVQDEARQIVAAQPGVAGVRWELDQHWLRAYSIELPHNRGAGRDPLDDVVVIADVLPVDGKTTIAKCITALRTLVR